MVVTADCEGIVYVESKYEFAAKEICLMVQ